MGGDFMLYFFLGISLIAGIAWLIRLLRDVCSPVRTVKAVVVHKQTVESFSKYSGTGKHMKYAVTFQTGNKKRSFYVSQMSYKGYRLNEHGVLKYKGSRLIDFS